MAKEAESLFVSEEKVVSRWISNCGTRLWSEEDIELVDSWLEFQRPFGVPLLRQSNSLQK
jgi:hypothetical protein